MSASLKDFSGTLVLVATLARILREEHATAQESRIRA
jgi:hypothetical protein